MNRPLVLLPLLLLAAACGESRADLVTEQGGQLTDDLTGITGVERSLTFRSSVYVPVGSDDLAIAAAIARQVRTGIGALRAPQVALNDRGAHSNLNPSGWTRRTVAVVDPATPTAAGTPLLEVTFPYADRAVVATSLDGRSALDFTVLFGDYAAWADGVRSTCSDDSSSDTDSLWYHFEPQRSSCQQAIAAEEAALTAEARALASRPDAIGPMAAARRFLTVHATLGAPQHAAAEHWPEYDRLYGLNDDGKRELTVYAFMGVDGYQPEDAYNPDDALAKEAMKMYRTLLRGLPTLRPVDTQPFAMLLDLEVDGRPLTGVTYEKLLGWIIDGTNLPPEVGQDAGKILALRRQALAKFAERRIEWVMPVRVTRADGSAKDLTVRLITFYGQEDGTPEARQRAQWRYLEAFWYGDVFAYNGHSHFGHGPLEPTGYAPWNFNGRYQVMLVNSCISFNYYHQDFFDLKPGGTKNLDMVVNGLPSWVMDGGVASGRFLVSLLSPQPKSYRAILESMRLDLPWATGYDPMRVADGELDNTFAPAGVTVTPLAPVYP